MTLAARLFRVLVALVVAIIMAVVALLVLSPLAGDVFLGGFRHFIDAVLGSDDPSQLIAATVGGMGRLLMLLTVVPVVMVGLIGEVAHWRSGLWYATGTAVLTAAIPWIMRGAWVNATSGEMRVTAYLGLVGLISGTIYWLIAGSRRPATTSNQGAAS